MKFDHSYRGNHPFISRTVQIWYVLPYLVLCLLLISCQMGNYGSSRWRSNQYGSGSGSNYNGGNGNSNGQNGTYDPGANAIPRDVQECDYFYGIADDFTAGCSGDVATLMSYLEELDENQANYARDCNQKFSRMGMAECSSIKTSIQQALTACSPIINWFDQYIDTESCKGVINKYTR